MDEKIRKFLSEDEIIERTKNCDKYFEEFVTPIGVFADVRPIIFSQSDNPDGLRSL